MPSLSSAEQRPAATILPSTTTGYLSIGDMSTFSEKLEATQVGKMLDQPELESFVNDLRRQLEAKMAKSDFQFEIELDDLKGVRSGELAFGMVRPEATGYAAVMLVDVTGKDDEAKQLLGDVERRLLGRGAQRLSEVRVANAVVTRFELQKPRGVKEAETVHYTLYSDWLIATNHEEVIRQLIERVDGGEADSLNSVAAYQEVKKRTEIEPRGVGDVVWFVEPIGLAETFQNADKNRKRGTDYVRLLRDQGFLAVQGMGGSVSLLTGQHELVHHTYVYAPPIQRESDSTNNDKYDLAMRMLDFDNGEGDMLLPESWIPAGSASYVTLTMQLKESFEYSRTLVDAKLGEGTFESVLENLRKQNAVDIRKSIVAHLDGRVTVITDSRLPITTTSDRWLAAIKLVGDDAARQSVRDTLQVIYDAEIEGSVQEHMVDAVKIWESIPVAYEDEENEFGIELPVGGFEHEEEEVQEESISGMKAVAVANGYIFASNDVDYVKEIILASAADADLSKEDDYQSMTTALDTLNPDMESVRSFSRADQVLRGTYELFRQGKMPEAESPFGRILNRMLGENEPGFVREPEIDASKLPADFEKFLAPYLGVSGWTVNQEKEGWRIIGCMLSKEQASWKL